MRRTLLIQTGLAVGLVSVAAGFWLGGGMEAKPADDVHPLEWDGHKWAQLETDEQLAFLAGFVVGAAASQGYAAAERDTAGFDLLEMGERTRALRAEGKLRYPFAPSLYHARLHDYFFYIDRRDRALYHAITELTLQLRPGETRPRGR